MERVTLRVPKEQMDEIRKLVKEGEYPNRSEAIRASIRGMLRYRRQVDGRRPMFQPGPEVETDAD